MGTCGGQRYRQANLDDMSESKMVIARGMHKAGVLLSANFRASRDRGMVWLRPVQTSLQCSDGDNISSRIELLEIDAIDTLQ